MLLLPTAASVRGHSSPSSQPVTQLCGAVSRGHVGAGASIGPAFQPPSPYLATLLPSPTLPSQRAAAARSMGCRRAPTPGKRLSARPARESRVFLASPHREASATGPFAHVVPGRRDAAVLHLDRVEASLFLVRGTRAVRIQPALYVRSQRLELSELSVCLEFTVTTDAYGTLVG